MKIYAAVRDAVDLVIKTNYANHAFTDYHTIRQQVYSWYENSDCVDPEVLAACALSYGYWSPGDTYEMMLEAHEYWFPHYEEDSLPIEEIEMMQHIEIY
jgi:hypothetical protein